MDSVAGWDRAWIGIKVALGLVEPRSRWAWRPAPADRAPRAAPRRRQCHLRRPRRAGPGHGPGLMGTITTESGSSWTVNATNGTAYTVTITPQTQFGTRRAPSTAQQFPIGSTVHVSGAANGNTITANRITAPKARKSASAAPTSPPG